MKASLAQLLQSRYRHLRDMLDPWRPLDSSCLYSRWLSNWSIDRSSCVNDDKDNRCSSEVGTRVRSWGPRVHINGTTSPLSNTLLHRSYSYTLRHNPCSIWLLCECGKRLRSRSVHSLSKSTSVSLADGSGGHPINPILRLRCVRRTSRQQVRLLDARATRKYLSSSFSSYSSRISLIDWPHQQKTLKKRESFHHHDFWLRANHTRARNSKTKLGKEAHARKQTRPFIRHAHRFLDRNASDSQKSRLLSRPHESLTHGNEHRNNERCCCILFGRWNYADSCGTNLFCRVDF